MKRLPVNLEALEGRHVSLALVDGTRIDDCQLVSAPRGSLRRVWIFADGQDRFLPLHQIGDAWETHGTAPRRPSASGPSRRLGARSSSRPPSAQPAGRSSGLRSSSSRWAVSG